MQTQAYNTYAAGTFGAMAAGFVQTALAEMLPWLFVMTAIIIADLFAGIAKTLKLRMPVRFSKAVRDTMAKFCVYFACVVCFAFYDVASGNNFYAEIACFLIMVIEAASIASNVLKYHGYNLDFNKLFSVIISKKFDIDPDHSEGIITKDEHKKRKSSSAGDNVAYLSNYDLDAQHDDSVHCNCGADTCDCGADGCDCGADGCDCGL